MSKFMVIRRKQELQQLQRWSAVAGKRT